MDKWWWIYKNDMNILQKFETQKKWIKLNHTNWEKKTLSGGEDGIFPNMLN